MRRRLRDDPVPGWARGLLSRDAPEGNGGPARANMPGPRIARSHQGLHPKVSDARAGSW